ncbi:hypothetical protein GCM10009665_17510 [Kitasatospora nipponensis]|uniref:PBP family phospholipid-binding protein n=1 Tax=Kitasatospora nipponensis TaxID=258049 RepID=A0ABN1VZ84_9ACTN
MQRTTRTLISAAATTAAAVLALGTATAAHSATHPDRFGHTRVRASIPQHTPRFTVTSPELAHGTFPAADYASSFGCTGANHAPSLHWSGAPASTRSYAISMFDQDAPTGSGFWHWMTWDLPGTTTTLVGPAPAGMVTGTTDAGTAGYLGPCPPVGDVAHHYVIRVVALDVPTLGLAADSTPALASFSLAMSGHIVGTAELTAAARR